jgi:hypothetical protein
MGRHKAQWTERAAVALADKVARLREHRDELIAAVSILHERVIRLEIQVANHEPPLSASGPTPAHDCAVLDRLMSLLVHEALQRRPGESVMDALLRAVHDHCTWCAAPIPAERPGAATCCADCERRYRAHQDQIAHFGAAVRLRDPVSAPTLQFGVGAGLVP